MIKKFVFVLMPFDDSFNDIYQLGIKGACEDLDLYCERVDEQIFEERILDRIYNQINKADIIIADMSNKNPNVFYETGYAHALNKRVMLLTQDADDIPFDLKHFPHIIYSNKITLLKEELTKRISYYINIPTHIAHSSFGVIELYLNGVNVNEKPNVILKEKKLDFLMECGFDFDLVFHNTGNSIFDMHANIALKIPREIAKEVNQYSVVDVPGDFVLYKYNNAPTLYPGEWGKVNIKIDVEHLDDSYNGVKYYPSEILVNTSYGSYNFPIYLELNFNAELRKSTDDDNLPF